MPQPATAQPPAAADREGGRVYTIPVPSPNACPPYELAARRYFRENGQTLFPSQTIELPEDVASEILRNEGPALKLARMTTQAHPEAVSAARPRRTRKAEATATS